MPDEARADTTAKRRPKSGCLGSVTVISSGGSVESENGRRASRCGLLYAVLVENQRIGEGAGLQQAMPIGIVAREPGHFRAMRDLGDDGVMKAA
jgi:hypothetical protein